MTSCGRRVPTIVSLPPLDRKTIRWPESSAEMSTVSSPALPSMVMVLKLRLVNGALKLPMTWMVSPIARPPSGGFGLLPLLAVVLSALTVISSILSSSAMTVVVSPTVRVMTISVLAPDTAIPAAMASALA